MPKLSLNVSLYAWCATPSSDRSGTLSANKSNAPAALSVVHTDRDLSMVITISLHLHPIKSSLTVLKQHSLFRILMDDDLITNKFIRDLQV